MASGTVSNFNHLILASHHYRDASEWIDGSVEKGILGQVKSSEVAWIACDASLEKLDLVLKPNTRVIVKVSHATLHVQN